MSARDRFQASSVQHQGQPIVFPAFIGFTANGPVTPPPATLQSMVGTKAD